MLLDCTINNRKITPFQCSDMIKIDKCNWYPNCRPRKELIEKIIPKHKYIVSLKTKS